jgi:hypothetical protein
MTTPTSGHAISIRVDHDDKAQALLPLAITGLVIAFGLAVAGLPPVDLHGPFHRLGIMDPLCGGTRALRLAARGDIAGALAWNPLSPILLAGAVAAVLRFAVGAATGRWVNVRIATDRRLLIAAAAVLVVLLEVRQQTNATMLMRTGY